MSTDKDFLKLAIAQSEESVKRGGFPVGAILAMNNEVMASGMSDGKRLLDATSHAEISVIREASREVGRRDLREAVVYSSLEPCLMCFAACYWAGVRKIVFACSKNKVSRQHYEGLHSLQDIDKANNRHIEIVHVPDLEGEALRVIQEWETKSKAGM